MQVSLNNVGLRELNPEETLLVAGGDYTTTNTDPDGAVITARYNDAGFLQELTADYSNSSATSASWSDDLFACVGVSEIGAFGACYGAGDIYIYGGGGIGVDGIPVDVTIGYSDNVAGILNGWSTTANGQPGFAASLNSDGSVAAMAYTVGTPGVSETYGMSLTEIEAAFSNAATEVSTGLYHMMGSPYDPPSGGGGDGGGGNFNDIQPQG
jgi:hypothetical protein